MSEPLVELVRREARAVRAVAARIRALELIVVAGQSRFLGHAVNDLDAAIDHLEALELARSLSVVAEGHDPDITVSDVLARPEDATDEMRHALEELAAATRELRTDQERTRVVVSTAAGGVRTRLEAGLALSTSS